MDDGTSEAATPRPLNPLEVVGQVLVVSAALLIISGVFYAWAFENTGWRDRLEIVSGYGASIITGVMVLGGIVALIGSRSERATPFAVTAQIVAGLVVVLALAAALSALTQSSEDSILNGGIGRSEWPTKLSVALPHIAAALLGAVVLVIANRRSEQ